MALPRPAGKLAGMDKVAFIVAGGWALLCAPAILIAEHCRLSQVPFHLSRPPATFVCLVSSVAFLARTRGSGSVFWRALAVVAALLSGLWLAFIVYVFLTLDFSMID